MSTLGFLMAILLGGLSIYIVWSFDRIVRWEHDNRYDDWIIDGKPCGVLWRSRECSLIGSYYAMRHLQFIWLFTTPGWADECDESRALFQHFRFGTVFSILAVILALLSLMLYMRNTPTVPLYNWAK